ncbi:MAG: hypothetical protein V4476_23935 [Pseudomonadota bacterium]
MNEFAVAISIILLPGLTASVICDKIVIHMVRWDYFKYSIYSFLFGVASYALLQLLAFFYVLLLKYFQPLVDHQYITLKVWLIIQNIKSPIEISEVAWAVGLSPFVAAFSSFIVNYKILNKISQKLKLSTKFGDENLFSFLLNSKEADWLYIRDKAAGLTYCGQIVSYSECDKIQEVVLSDVKIFDYESSDELYEVSIVYLSKPLGEFVIEIPKKITQEEPCDDNEETG